ncbi:MAG: hypothetical protein ACJ79S_19480, partial [Gemmatimonadaceae bacterium]
AAGAGAEAGAASRATAMRVAADSAAGDSAARDALPPALAAPLAVEPYLADHYVAATTGGDCVVQEAAAAPELRRRVHLRLPDSSALVVFARADTGTLELRRVEVVRNPVGDEQLGFVWDSDGDRTTEVRWPARGRGHPETVPYPRGGPLPRALRALGRRLLTLACPAAGPPAAGAAGAR